MNDFFEQHIHLYENRYTLEAWIVYCSLWAQYILYYICLISGFVLLLCLISLPFFTAFGLVKNIKIKIKTNKINKHKKKLKEDVEKEYLKTLDSFTKKKKKHK